MYRPFFNLFDKKIDFMKINFFNLFTLQNVDKRLGKISNKRLNRTDRRIWLNNWR